MLELAAWCITMATLFIVRNFNATILSEQFQLFCCLLLQYDFHVMWLSEHSTITSPSKSYATTSQARP